MNPVNAFIARLKEPSTWSAIFAALLAIGISVDPGLQQNIAATGAGVAGLLAFFLPEKGATKQ